MDTLNKDILRRNIRVRMAALCTDVGQISDTLGVSKGAVYKRLTRLCPVDLYWWSTVLVVSPEHLTHPDVIYSVTPDLPPGWLSRVKGAIGKPYEYDRVLEMAFDEWQNTTLQEQ